MNALTTIISRTLLIVFALTAVLLIGGLIALVRGITWDSLSLPNIRLEGGQLQLESKLNLDIARVVIAIDQPRDKSVGPVDPAQLQTLLKLTKTLSWLFATVDIRKIEVGNAVGDFSYRHEGRGHLNATGEGITMALALSTSGEKLIVDIHKLMARNGQLNLSGQASIHTRKMVLEAQLSALLAEELPVSIALQADRNRVTFKGRGEKPVSQIAAIVELFDLDPDIVPWISDYTRGSEYALGDFSGAIPYDDPAALLRTLRVEALVTDTQYTFAQGLQPAMAAETRIVFNEGILHIYPRDSSFYGQSGGDTYVDIDFNHNRFLLSVYVRTQAQLSGGILALMDFYGIPLPIEQVQGLTDANLVITIDLESEKVDATGRFIAKNSVFTLGEGQLHDVQDLDISLDSSVVSFNHLSIAMADLFAADVNGQIDFGPDTGNLNIELRHFHWEEQDTTLLLPANETLSIDYRINPLGDSVAIPASSWNTAGVPIQVGAFHSLFNPVNFSGSLDAVEVSIGPGLKADVTGSFQSESPYANLNISVKELNLQGIQLQQPPVELHALIKADSLLSLKTRTHLSGRGFKLALEPVTVHYSGDTLRIDESRFEMGEHFTGSFSGTHDFSDTSSTLLLTNLLLKDTSDARELLSGQLHIATTGASAPYSLLGEISAPAGILVNQDGSPITEYRLSGTQHEKKLEIDINQTMNIEWSDKLKIRSNRLGFHLPAILDAIAAGAPADRAQSSQSEIDELEIALFAENSAVWIDEKRSMPADSITLQSLDGSINAQLEYQSGMARLNYEDSKFLLAGAEFGSDFFDPIIDLAQFDGGTMAFNIEGNTSQIQGVFSIRDTLISDYKHLNNMLAFANTLPGLLTFNPPNYNRDGLPIREGYAEFKFGDEVLTVDAVLLESDELSLTGTGILDMEREITDMTFEMEIGVRKSLARIPLLGYIIAGGEEDSSLVLKVEGDMYDPNITNSATRDVLTYPLQLVKRTILLPSHVVDKSKKHTLKKSAEQESSSMQPVQ